MEKKLLEIGDKILVDANFLNFKWVYTIDRVTKTKAVGTNKDGLVAEFKRVYNREDLIWPYKSVEWDRTTRKLIK